MIQDVDCRNRNRNCSVIRTGFVQLVTALLLLGAWPAQAITFDLLGQFTRSEGAGTFDLTVRLTATAAESATGTCSVPVRFFVEGSPPGVPSADGSDFNFAGQDFDLSLPSGTGVDVSVEETFTVTILDDGIVEPVLEGLVIVGDVPSALCFGQRVDSLNAGLFIQDDDALIFSFGPPASVSESQSMLSTNLVLTNPGAAPPGFSASVTFVAQDGTAEQGSDYQLFGLTADAMFNSQMTQFPVEIAILDDTDPESDETFQIVGGSPSANDGNGFDINVSVSNSFQATIIDDDQSQGGGPIVTIGSMLGFTFTDITVLEDTGVVTLSVVPDFAPADTATVDFQSIAGSAQESADYLPVSGTLTFPPGSVQAQTIEVTIVDDGDVESAETFSVGLLNPIGGTIDPMADSVLVTIDDNDPNSTSNPVLGFTISDINVLEDVGVVNLSVTPDVAPVNAVTVDFQSTDSSAEAPSDYSPAAGTLTFPAGTVEPQTIAVMIVNDLEDESGEAFRVGLINPVGATIDSTADSVLVVISDNDTAAGSNITLTGAPGETVNFIYGGAFGNADRSTQQPFSDVSSSGTEPNVTVTYSATIPSTATAGQSFSDVVEANIDMPPPVEAFITINVVTGATSTEYAFATTAVDVAEDAGSVALQIMRLGDLSLSGSVTYTTVGGTAVGDDDFALTQDTVAFGPGEAGPISVTVDIIDDADVEATETFSVELVNPLDGTISATSGVATVSIADNDQAQTPLNPGTVQFTASEITVDESAGTVDVQVSREGGSDGGFTVNFDALEGTALEGSDFAPASGVLEWVDGQTDTMTITIELVADTEIEGIEDFTVELSNFVTTSSGGSFTPASLGTPTSITISITDIGRDIAGISGLSANQIDMAQWFDDNCDALINSNPNDPNQQDLATICASLRSVNTTDQQVRDGLDAVNAEELATAATTTLRLLGDQHGNLQRRLNGLRSGASGIDLAGLNVTIGGQQISGVVLEEMLGGIWGAADEQSDFGRWGFFVDGKIDFGERDENEANNGYDLDSTLITFGADYRVRDNFFIGGAIGYADADIDFNGGGGLDFEAWRGSVYTTYFASERYYIDGLITYGTTDYDSSRRIVYTGAGGSIDRTATGSTDGDMFTAGFGSGFDFNKGGFTFGPNFGAYYFDVNVDGYSETGALGLNLDIGDQNAKSFTVNAGGHASFVINTPVGVIIPNARFDLVHEFEDGVEQVGIRFAADPFTNDPTSPSSPIIVRSEQPDENYFVWSVGASAQFIRGFSGFVTYQSTEGFSNLKLNEISFGMRWEKTF